MILGAQKSATTALSEFLNEHPMIEMAQGKEAHIFDDAKFNNEWFSGEIERRYDSLFDNPDASIKGEATPVYLYFPEIAERLRRYNPELKLIVILRDPVERAYSHYLMEKKRGNESLPFCLALLIESYRLHRDREYLSEDSSLRRHSYRDRGYYFRQLNNLFRSFEKDQVLVIQSEWLRERHEETLRQVHDFLDIDEFPTQSREVFSQSSNLSDVPMASLFLRRCFRKDLVKLEELVEFSTADWR
ncbi:MAG: sulfotransferase domain-containing protein [Pseudomonadales bacterium]|nr:sulfotransferase domain-containing protein [Pseudomonadales bacterium]MBO7004635.1 sulfotransferase domain-containing protein [Pseudomonadales bacterium]